MNKILFIAIALIAVTFGSPGHALLIEIIPGAASYEVNDEVTVDVMVGDLMGELVGAYDLGVGYDSTFLTFGSTSFDVFLDGPDFSIQGDLAGSDTVNVFETSLGLLENQDGFTDFRLFSLSFTAISAGVVDLSLDLFELGGFFGEPLEASLFGTQIVINDNVAAVPVPPALILFMSGLMGLVGLQRRKRSTAI